MKTLCARVLSALLLLAAFQAVAAPTMAETPRMRRIGTEQGLPSRMVTAITQDQQGYMWFATDDGLARYDGVEFRVWRHDPDDADSLAGNAVETMLVDPHDRIWVGSNSGGLNMLPRGRAHFRQFPGFNHQCQGEYWALAYADDALWVGTSRAGLCRLDEDGHVTVFRARAGDPSALPDDTIYTAVTDAQGRLWVGTHGGLVRWNGKGFVRVDPERLHVPVFKLSLDPDGTVWVGTSEGLWRIGADDQLTQAPWQGTADVRSASILHDRSGGYWLGTAAGLFRAQGQRMQLLSGDLGSGYLTASSGVLDVQQDREGGVWFAMMTQGVLYLPPAWRRFSTFFEVNGESLESLYLINTASDGDDFLFNTAEAVYRFHPVDGSAQKLVGLDTLGLGSIWSVLPRADGSLWIGRAGHIIQYWPKTRRSRRFDTGYDHDQRRRVEILRAAPGGDVWSVLTETGLQHWSGDGELLETLHFGTGDGLPDSQVEQMRFAPDGRLWIADELGLFVRQGGRFTRVPGIEEAPVQDFVFTDAHTLWLARPGVMERYQWDGTKMTLNKRIGRRQGMPAVDIGGLVIGRQGEVWATTPRGLVRYTPDDDRVRTFGAAEGLPDTQFSLRLPAVNADGMVLALAATGVVVFDPSHQDGPLPDVPLVIDAVHVRRNDAEREQVLASTGKAVSLKAGDRDLRITARLLSYIDPAANRYRFRIEGYDQNWVESGSTGERVLSRLPSGDYTIQVQARRPGGNWVASAPLGLVVAPPWWKTPACLTLWAVLLLASLTLGVFLYRRRLQRLQEWKLALHKQALAEQASQAKTRFLATLGHEVRTPMTGVLGMSELLLAAPLGENERSRVEAIRAAGTHLLRLVNDALDLARIEAGKLVLEQLPFELRSVLDELINFMEPVAQARGLRLDRQVEVPAGTTVMGDVTRVRQIVVNLLSNATKFTEQGTVTIVARLQQGEGVVIEVADTGPGISPEQQLRIFRRFEQADGARTAARYGGSGLGLAICQELAIAMGGEISLESQLGKGTRFRVVLPLPWSQVEAPSADTPVFRSDETPLEILLVEDDATVAEVITGLLQVRGHHVVHVPHGLAALSEASGRELDIGLLDLDLPGLDGLALARQFRTMGRDFPLVAVTARADAQAETQAMAAGFDGFVRKPVTGEILALAIDMAITQRRRTSRRRGAGTPQTRERGTVPDTQERTE